MRETRATRGQVHLQRLSFGRPISGPGAQFAELGTPLGPGEGTLMNIVPLLPTTWAAWQYSASGNARWTELTTLSDPRFMLLGRIYSLFTQMEIGVTAELPSGSAANIQFELRDPDGSVNADLPVLPVHAVGAGTTSFVDVCTVSAGWVNVVLTGTLTSGALLRVYDGWAADVRGPGTLSTWEP